MYIRQKIKWMWYKAQKTSDCHNYQLLIWHKLHAKYCCTYFKVYTSYKFRKSEENFLTQNLEPSQNQKFFLEFKQEYHVNYDTFELIWIKFQSFVEIEIEASEPYI
jgi:hypothetical protein